MSAQAIFRCLTDGMVVQQWVCDFCLPLSTYNMFEIFLFYSFFILSPRLLFCVYAVKGPIGTFPINHSHFGESVCWDKFFTTFFLISSFQLLFFPLHFLVFSASFRCSFQFAGALIKTSNFTFLKCKHFFLRLCCIWNPLHFLQKVHQFKICA